ncbi:MAG: Gmad2 immunoglobulin-like domain-containing protein [bacterium]|nr:Gmad2 immunoglobulin-like domain-containing protein [bacterium]
MKVIFLIIIIIISAAGYFAVEQAGNSNESEVQKGNAFVKYDLIRVTSPISGSLIKSPVLIKGIARGYWFFEGDFLVKVLDGAGEELGIGIAQATEEWMTTEFVPFAVTITFTEPSTKEGTIVLYRDNPSGLPEFDDELLVPVHF